MKHILTFGISVLLTIFLKGQIPKIAVVKPDGVTTNIFDDLPSAYNYASNGDIIYLPGGNFSFNGDSIAKKIFVFGAGTHVDSTTVTGKTKIVLNSSSEFQFKDGSQGSSFEGIDFLQSINPNFGNIHFGGLSQININCCKFFRAEMGTSCIIRNSILVGASSLSNSIISNCFFNSQNQVSILNCGSSTFQNCIFRSQDPCCYAFIQSSANCIIRNCVFPHNGMQSNSSSCTFYNNIQFTGYSAQSNEFNTIILNSVSEIFTTNMSQIVFNEAFNYELSNTCAGNNAGTDGTDVGIYGTSLPCPKGWVPTNPHIYYKNVGLQSTPEGKLQINFKVRSGN